MKRPFIAAAPPAATPVIGTVFVPPQPARLDGTNDGIAAIMRAQVEAMSNLIQGQLDALRRLGLAGDAPAAAGPGPAAAPAPPPAAASEVEQRPSRFQAYRAGARGADSGVVSPAQTRHIEALTARLTAKTAGSKQRTAAARPVLADPRAASGFRLEWKELVYPIVCARAHRLADLGHRRQ